MIEITCYYAWTGNEKKRPKKCNFDSDTCNLDCSCYLNRREEEERLKKEENKKSKKTWTKMINSKENESVLMLDDLLEDYDVTALAYRSQLTPQQQLFCIYYVQEMNGSQAARKAGYSPKSAGAQAGQLKKNPRVAAEIARLAEEKIKGADKRFKRESISADRVLEENAKVGYSNIQRYFDKEKGYMLPVHEWEEDDARAIQSIKSKEIWRVEKEDYTLVAVEHKIKLWDKIKAVEMLGKHLKLFTTDININERKEINYNITASIQAQFEGLPVEDLKIIRDLLIKARKIRELIALGKDVQNAEVLEAEFEVKEDDE